MPPPPTRSTHSTSPAKLRTILARAEKSVQHVDRNSIAATGLCPSDFAVLEILLHKGPLPVNTIGAKVLLTSGSISTAIDRLQDRDLVTRVSHPNDRRVCNVHLTPAGKRLINKAFAQHEKNLERAMQSLSQREKNDLARLLKKLGLNAAEHAAESQAKP